MVRHRLQYLGLCEALTSAADGTVTTDEHQAYLRWDAMSELKPPEYVDCNREATEIIGGTRGCTKHRDAILTCNLLDGRVLVTSV